MAASDQIPGQEFEYVAPTVFFSPGNRIGVGMVGRAQGQMNLLSW
jgi:hypothetical protein